jgi:hypothetical protein
MSLRRIDHLSRGVLPTVARRCVWSRNLENEEAKAPYWAVKIQPQWVLTQGKQQQHPSVVNVLDSSLCISVPKSLRDNFFYELLVFIGCE